MKQFQLHIWASDRSFYEGACESLIVPALDGALGVEANHLNAVTAIVPGKLTYRVPGGRDEDVAVSGGILKIEDNEVVLLVDTAERPEEIDLKRAERAEAAAQEALLQKQTVAQYKTTKAELARAMNRLRIKRGSINN